MSLSDKKGQSILSEYNPYTYFLQQVNKKHLGIIWIRMKSSDHLQFLSCFVITKYYQIATAINPIIGNGDNPTMKNIHNLNQLGFHYVGWLAGWLAGVDSKDFKYFVNLFLVQKIVYNKDIVIISLTSMNSLQRLVYMFVNLFYILPFPSLLLLPWRRVFLCNPLPSTIRKFIFSFVFYFKPRNENVIQIVNRFGAFLKFLELKLLSQFRV